MNQGGSIMNEKFFEAFLVLIIVPYGLMFLIQLWNVFGPSLRSRWRTYSGE